MVFGVALVDGSAKSKGRNPDEKPVAAHRLAHKRKGFKMKRLMMLLLVALALPATAFAGINNSAGATCMQTGFYRDSINLTAAQIGGDVTGDLDATGCDIGVYYGPGAKGSVTKATITNAKYFGVVNYRGKVNVKNSTISQIGNTPFDGSQHGVGILYTTEKDPYGETSGTAKGTISGNILHSYQKNGIVVRGAGASAQIAHNTMTGSGKIAYIAQNGIQVSYNASATVTGNTVSEHWYTPDTNEACGLLFYQAGNVKVKQLQKANNLSNNEVNVYAVA